MEVSLKKRILTGNEALAWGALRAGVKVVTGYPGTPSTGALASFLTMDLPDRHVEWSTNEKVAFEIAAAAGLGGPSRHVHHEDVGGERGLRLAHLHRLFGRQRRLW